MKASTLAVMSVIVMLALGAGCSSRPASVSDDEVEVKAVPAPSTSHVPVLNEPLPPGTEKDPLEGPRVLYLDVPNYPAVAKENRLDGSVLVELFIDRTGTVDSARVVESTNTVFDRSALAAAYRCRFEPGKIGTQPLEFRWIIPFEFSLDPSREGPSSQTEATGWKKVKPVSSGPDSKPPPAAPR